MVTIEARLVGIQARRLRSDVFFRFTKKQTATIRLHSHRSLSPGDEDSVSYHSNNIKRLDRLYYTNFDFSNRITAATPDNRSPSLPGMTIEDLPLWRVIDFAVLPAHQVVLHVHLPHYCDMFNRLFAGPQPWQFGHQCMVGSPPSENGYDTNLHHDSEYPRVGTLMEVLRVMREPDGRLIILAAGIGRFSIVQTLQTWPHSRSNVILLPDVEEIEFLANNLESLTEQTAMQKIAAAAVSAAAWWDYELSHRTAIYRHNLHVVDRIEHPKRANHFEQYLVNAIGLNEVIEMPWADKSIHRTVKHLLCGDQDVCVETEESTAIQLAEEAAKVAVHKMMSTLEGMNETELERLDAIIYSLHDVGIYKFTGHISSVSHELENDDGAISNIGRCALQSGGEKAKERYHTSLAACLRLENEIWELLDDISAVTEKLGRALPHSENGLLCLRHSFRENSNAQSCSTFLKWSGTGAHPQYPALRRLQRLSFAVASVGTRQDEEGRQRLLECTSIKERLMLGLSQLKRCKAEAMALKLQQPLAADGVHDVEQPGSANIIMWCIRRVVTFINFKTNSECDDRDSL